MTDSNYKLKFRRNVIAFPIFVTGLWALLVIESLLSAQYVLYQFGEDVFDRVIREETFLSNWPFYRIPIELGLFVGSIVVAKWQRVSVVVGIMSFIVAFWLMGLSFRYYIFDLFDH